MPSVYWKCVCFCAGLWMCASYTFWLATVHVFLQLFWLPTSLPDLMWRNSILGRLFHLHVKWVHDLFGKFLLGFFFFLTFKYVDMPSAFEPLTRSLIQNNTNSNHWYQSIIVSKSSVSSVSVLGPTALPYAISSGFSVLSILQSYIWWSFMTSFLLSVFLCPIRTPFSCKKRKKGKLVTVMKFAVNLDQKLLYFLDSRVGL